MLAVLVAAVFACVAGVSGASSWALQTRSCPGNQGLYLASFPAYPDTAYIWSTVGIPTLTVVHGPNVSTSVDFENWQCPTGLNFSTSNIMTGGITAVSSIVLTTVYEFNDASNHVEFVPPAYANTNVLSSASFSDLLWAPPTNATGVLNLTGTSDMMDVSILISLQAESGRESVLPKNAFPDYASTVSLVVKNYKYNNTNWIGKLAIEAFLPSTNNAVSLDNSYSLDDEYMPKIFQTSLLNFQTTPQMTMSFRSCAFGSASRDGGNFTVAQFKTVYTAGSNSSNMSSSVASVFVGGGSVRYSYLVFGLDGDQAFNFPYLLFDFVHAVGKPSGDSLSVALILVMIVTTCLPGLALVFGGLYLAYHAKKRTAKPTYERIN
eukprot:m.605254 g.605254  ORF g.605254 m.605254 type:complete len:378 (-) comp58109_c0_seq3:247-1380(-)